MRLAVAQHCTATPSLSVKLRVHTSSMFFLATCLTIRRHSFAFQIRSSHEGHSHVNCYIPELMEEGCWGAKRPGSCYFLTKSDDVVQMSNGNLN
jgi:hypothetical protein